MQIRKYAWWVVFAVFIMVGCGTTPEMKKLNEGMDAMESLLWSNVVTSTVRTMDPAMKPSTAVSAVFTPVVTAHSPQPPAGIRYAPQAPTGAWVVVIKADDEKKQVIIEGYGEDLAKPLVTRRVKYPPH